MTPIDMVLYCPKCALQHIDAPDPEQDLTGTQHELIDGRLTATPYTYRGRPAGAWLNPPHKSHLCAGCGHVWRPSDHPTNGVLRTASGKDADTAPLHVIADYNRIVYDAIAGAQQPCCGQWWTCTRVCVPRQNQVDGMLRGFEVGNATGNPHCLSSGACAFPRCECPRPTIAKG